MKRRITAVIALLAVMAVFTGTALAGDVEFCTSSATDCVAIDNPIPGLDLPGDSVIVFFHAAKLNPDNVQNHATYKYSVVVTKVTPTGSVPTNDVVLMRNGNDITGQTFVPDNTIYTDPTPITIIVKDTAPIGSEYDLSLNAETDGIGKPIDKQTASRQIKLIRPNTTLTKTPDSSSGGPRTVTYTYEEKNTGNVNLTNVRVDDDKCSPVDPILKANGKNAGDANDDSLLNPGETWKFTCQKSYNDPGTYINNATGHGNPIINGRVIDEDITYPVFPTERASTTITVGGECKDRCKVVGWGTLGTKAAPELKFKIFAYTGFLPKGTVEVEDNAGNKIVATEINSVKTNKNVDPKTGEITGKATFNGDPVDFVVNVKDGGEPTYGPYVSKDWFKISVPAKTYTKEGTLTSGDLQVIY
ncbi:MAG TPA: hypothetical protein VIO58_00055 [Candidatus Methanoperedens sp.]